MSSYTLFTCDGPGCGTSSLTGGKLPMNWSKGRGFQSPEDREPLRAARPAIHFCPTCTSARKKAHDDRRRLRIQRRALEGPRARVMRIKAMIEDEASLRGRR